MAHIDHAEAARAAVTQLLQTPELDRAELAEFVDVIYNSAVAMWPTYRRVTRHYYATRNYQLAEAEKSKPAEERQIFYSGSPPPSNDEVMKELFQLTNTNNPRIGGPVPEGTMEACDEVLQNQTENEWVAEHGNPFKPLDVWAESDVGAKHIEAVRQTLNIPTSGQEADDRTA